MNKESLKELIYDIERIKNWSEIHNLIMEYSKSYTNEEISPDIFDVEWWQDFRDSVYYGEILDKENFFDRDFFVVGL